MRPAQSILKRKPLQKRAFEKYKPRGLFSEFYGIIHVQRLFRFLSGTT